MRVASKKIGNCPETQTVDGVRITVTSRLGDFVARGEIANADGTATPCWIARDGKTVAYGRSLGEARAALRCKPSGGAK